MRYTAYTAMRIPIPDVCAMNINVIVLTTLGNVWRTAAVRTAAVILFICSISSIRQADTAMQTISRKPCTAGTLYCPPRGWIYFRNHLPR